MMNQQQPDNFFREKLHNYQKPAPQGAWDKIESALEKKTGPKFTWWKVAAVFFLIGGACYILWFDSTNSHDQPLARVQDQSLPAPEKGPKKITESAEHKTPEKPSEVEVTPKAKIKKPATIQPDELKQSEVATEELQKNLVAIENDAVSASIDQAQKLPAHADSQTVEHSQSKATKSTMTLTFSSEETDQYLNKNALAEATSNEKKPSSLKKFLKKANDLKSNQDPFGDLRERKNEILALNFKNDKRGQNK